MDPEPVVQSIFQFMTDRSEPQEGRIVAVPIREVKVSDDVQITFSRLALGSHPRGVIVSLPPSLNREIAPVPIVLVVSPPTVGRKNAVRSENATLQRRASQTRTRTPDATCFLIYRCDQPQETRFDPSRHNRIEGLPSRPCSSRGLEGRISH
jgi:hypothetical protein